MYIPYKIVYTAIYSFSNVSSHPTLRLSLPLFISNDKPVKGLRISNSPTASRLSSKRLAGAVGANGRRRRRHVCKKLLLQRADLQMSGDIQSLDGEWYCSDRSE